MPFVEEIARRRSLSIVGLEKNTGKTVCLNYILRRLDELARVSVSVTSIGVDGEQVDSVYATAKPEVRIYSGMRFVTSEGHYVGRRLLSRIVDVDSSRTAMGRLVTAEALSPGEVILSGPSSNIGLQRLLSRERANGVGLTIVDGALSRLSLASPAVTEAMVLATGAAVSPSLSELVRKTVFVKRLVDLPQPPAAVGAALADATRRGLWAVDSDGVARDLGLQSALLINADTDLLRYGKTLYVGGVVSSSLLSRLSTLGRDIALVVDDFTKLFITPDALASFQRVGGHLYALQKSCLVALTVNPTSPHGYLLDSRRLCDALTEATGIPTYDVMKIERFGNHLT